MSVNIFAIFSLQAKPYKNDNEILAMTNLVRYVYRPVIREGLFIYRDLIGAAHDGLVLLYILLNDNY